MFVVSQESSTKKGPAEIQKMRESARIVQSIFDDIEPLIIEGAFPDDLRELIVKKARSLGANMSMDQVGFCRHGYVHPPTDENSPLHDDEVFTLDIWLSYGGWYADLARPYLLSACPEKKRLYNAARACQQKAIETVESGQKFLSLVEAVQQVAQSYGCHILDGACGHGIGNSLHEEPLVSFTYASNNLFDTIPSNLVLTLEVAVSLNPCRLIQDEYGYTRSDTGEVVLYAEAMVAIKENNVELVGI
ncbi:MAG: M24 family metallopeptidase [Spirochaetia bacterium]